MKSFTYKDIHISLADNFFSRFFGLMLKKSMASTEGLLITPCRQVHTFGMHFAIDVLFLKDGRVRQIESALSPWRISSYVKGADSVLELAAGMAGQLQIMIGDEIHDCSSRA